MYECVQQLYIIHKDLNTFDLPSGSRRHFSRQGVKSAPGNIPFWFRELFEWIPNQIAYEQRERGREKEGEGEKVANAIYLMVYITSIYILYIRVHTYVI